MSRLLSSLVLAVAVALPLAACQSVLDGNGARLCRAALPVLNAQGAVIDVTATNSIDLPSAPGVTGVRIDYLAKAPGRSHRARYLLCYFEKPGFGAQTTEIDALITEQGHVSEPALVFINRYLGEPDALAETPGPGTIELASLPLLGEPFARLLQHGLALLPMTGVYALLATSYALIYGLIGRIDLAFGAFAALGGVGGSLVLLALQGAGGFGVVTSPFATLAIALLLAVSLGASWGEAKAAFVLNPLARRDFEQDLTGARGRARHTGQPILIATAGLLIAIPELLSILEPQRWLTPLLNVPMLVARSESIFVTVTPIALTVFAVSMVLALGVLALMRFTAFGRAWRACADDPLTASLFGISPTQVLSRTVTLACALAGFAGFVFCVHYGNMGYSDGRTLGLKALVAAIAGGIGSLKGAVLGGILLGVAEAVWSANLPIEHRDVAIFMALVALLVFRPGGLFGFGDLSPRRV